MRKIVLVVLLLFVSCQMTGNVALEQETIKVGMVTSLSGENSIAGNWARQGLEVAKEEINSEGGINGIPLEIIYEDSQWNPRLALLGAKKLVEADGVDSIITLSGASSALSIQPYADSKGIVQVELVCVISACRQKDDNLFRVTGPPSDQPKFLASQTKGLEVAVIYINNDYGASQKDFYLEHHSDVVAIENYEQGETDFRAIITEVMNEEPQAIVLFSHTYDTGHFLKQAGELGVDVPIYGGFPAQNPGTLEIAGLHAEGFMYSYFDYRQGEEFREKYEERYGEEPEVFASKAYDALQILAEVMRICDDPEDAECFIEEIYRIENFSGAMGSMTIDEYGDLSEERFSLKKVEHGSFVWV